MNNWWIAVLEHFGLLTHEEAKHLADTIKVTMGSDNYDETFEIVGNIIEKGKFKDRRLLSDIEKDLSSIEGRVYSGKDLAKRLDLQELQIKKLLDKSNNFKKDLTQVK